MTTKQNNSSAVDQLAGDATELFQATGYANKQRTEIVPAIRVNAPGCGWGSVPARVIALTLKHPEQARKALERVIALKNDPAEAKAIIDAAKAKDAAKKAKAKAKATTAEQSSDELDGMMSEL